MKEKIKLGFNIFLYLSFAFVAWFLYKQDYLVIPSNFDWGWMSASLLALWIGFICNAIQWVPLLRSQGMTISYSDSIRTFGMSVFGKYIPGKVWVHLGKSAQIAEAYGYSILKVSEVSFFSQIITLWVGVLAGLGLLFYMDKIDLLFWSLLGAFILFSVLITTQSIQKIAKWFIKLILKREFRFSSLPPLELIKILPLYFLSIIAYSVGFLFLAKSLGAVGLAAYAMFIFPLAMTIGVIAIIVPGGLGVREVIIASLLGDLYVSQELANSISISSRLWFLLGETFIFLLGLWFHRKWKKNLRPTS